MNSPFLIGEQVYLRPLEQADAPVIAPWFNDAEVTQFTLRYLPISLRAEEEFLANLAKSDKDIVLGIALRETDRLIGATGLHAIDWRNRQTGFGITLGVKEEWGKGHGTEATRLIVGYAFDTLNLNRVWLHAYEYNARALHIYERVGFSREGILRQETFRHGRYWDTIVMAILREEYEQQKRAV